jgi:hypothetical protein
VRAARDRGRPRARGARGLRRPRRGLGRVARRRPGGGPGARALAAGVAPLEAALARSRFEAQAGGTARGPGVAGGGWTESGARASEGLRVALEPTGRGSVTVADAAGDAAAGSADAPEADAVAGGVLEVGVVGASAESRAALVEGLVIYRDAYPSTDAIVGAVAGHADVFYLLHDASAPRAWPWIVAGAGLRAERRAGAIVLVDARGAERSRVRAPGAVDARGRPPVDRARRPRRPGRLRARGAGGRPVPRARRPSARRSELGRGRRRR